jgi:hypothetical protein
MCVIAHSNAFLERNDSNEDHGIGLLTLLQNTSLIVFCSNDLYHSTSAENPSKN